MSAVPVLPRRGGKPCSTGLNQKVEVSVIVSLPKRVQEREEMDRTLSAIRKRLS